MKKIAELSAKIKKPETTSHYPKSLNSKAKRALYDNLNKDEQLAIVLDAEVTNTKKDGWRGNKIKEREIKNAIRKHISNEQNTEKIFQLIKNQSEY